jgi:Leucine-rich repeat (LRR) protein
LTGCRELTDEGLAPLQHLTGLTKLVLIVRKLSNITKFPNFICNFTSLKELYLGSPSINTLPDALDNLTSLQRLGLYLRRLTMFPISIGDLKALKSLHLDTCRKSVLSPKTQEVLQRLRQHGAQVRVSEYKKLK